MTAHELDNIPDIDDARSKQTAWQAFRLLTGSNNYETYKSAYLGSWPSREAFGSYLLEDFGAAARLEELPTWLQRYVSLAPERITQDFEDAGHYRLVEGRDAVYVFDGHVRSIRRLQR